MASIAPAASPQDCSTNHVFQFEPNHQQKSDCFCVPEIVRFFASHILRLNLCHPSGLNRAHSIHNVFCSSGSHLLYQHPYSKHDSERDKGKSWNTTLLRETNQQYDCTFLGATHSITSMFRKPQDILLSTQTSTRKKEVKEIRKNLHFSLSNFTEEDDTALFGSGNVGQTLWSIYHRILRC